MGIPEFFASPTFPTVLDLLAAYFGAASVHLILAGWHGAYRDHLNSAVFLQFAGAAIVKNRTGYRQSESNRQFRIIRISTMQQAVHSSFAPH